MAVGRPNRCFGRFVFRTRHLASASPGLALAVRRPAGWYRCTVGTDGFERPSNGRRGAVFAAPRRPATATLEFWRHVPTIGRRCHLQYTPASLRLGVKHELELALARFVHLAGADHLVGVCARSMVSASHSARVDHAEILRVGAPIFVLALATALDWTVRGIRKSS